jgi:GH15 family glucan-1,4-alpha-glucosidase
MLTYATHRGLYAEQISRTGQQGNSRQALTHLALISAAFNLDRARYRAVRISSRQRSARA